MSETRCNGCRYLRWEHFRGEHTALCLDPDKPVLGIRRALQQNTAWPTSGEPAVIRPVWCGKAPGCGDNPSTADAVPLPLDRGGSKENK